MSPHPLQLLLALGLCWAWSSPSFLVWQLGGKATCLMIQPHIRNTLAKLFPCKSIPPDDCHGSWHSWGSLKSSLGCAFVAFRSRPGEQVVDREEACWVPRSKGAYYPTRAGYSLLAFVTPLWFSQAISPSEINNPQAVNRPRSKLSQMNEAQRPGVGECHGSYHITWCHEISYEKSTRMFLYLPGASLLIKHR